MPFLGAIDGIGELVYLNGSDRCWLRGNRLQCSAVGGGFSAGTTYTIPLSQGTLAPGSTRGAKTSPNVVGRAYRGSHKPIGIRGLGKDGENQRKFADVLDSISQGIRGERRSDVLGNPCGFQNILLYAGVAYAGYKLIELVVKNR